MKATGEIVEKSAYATRDLSAQGMRKVRESRSEGAADQEPSGEDGPDYGSDEYYEKAR